MTINTELIITICVFVGVMYTIYRIFNYLDYEQRHQEKKQIIRIENADDPENQKIRLKEWDN